MLIAKSNITFRSHGQLYNYSPGDIILAKHEPIVKFYYSGQVVDKEMFNIKNATININFNKEPVIKNSVDELKESLESATTVVKELKESIEKLAKEPVKKESKKDATKITIDSVSIPPSDEGIELTGSVGDTTTEGPDINHKVGKLKRVKQGEPDNG